MASSPSEPDTGGDGDERWMARALELARDAAARDEVPVGAVIVRDGVVLGEGHNLTVTEADPTTHAEIVAIRRASEALGDWRLVGATLYVSLEPCAMCAGAIVLARIPRVVFGAHDPKAGMAGSLENLLQDSRLNHRCDVTSGVMAEEASVILKTFFQSKR